MWTDKDKAARKAKYAKRAEYERNLSREWYREHRVEAAARKRAKYRENPQAQIAKAQKWQKNNPLRHALGAKAQGANRRAKKLGITERITRQEVLSVFSRCDWLCQACHAEVDLSGHLDHVQAMALGGSNTKDNLQVLCETCHYGKSSRERNELKARKALSVSSKP